MNLAGLVRLGLGDLLDLLARLAALVVLERGVCLGCRDLLENVDSRVNVDFQVLQVVLEDRENLVREGQLGNLDLQVLVEKLVNLGSRACLGRPEKEAKLVNLDREVSLDHRDPQVPQGLLDNKDLKDKEDHLVNKVSKEKEDCLAHQAKREKLV